MKLQTKLLLFFLPTVLLSGTAVTLIARNALHWIMVDETGKAAIAKLTQESAALTEALQHGSEVDLLPRLYALQESTEALYGMVLDDRGHVLAHTNVVETGKRYADAMTVTALQQQQPNMREAQAQGKVVMDISVPLWATEEEPLLAGLNRTRLGTIRLGLSLKRVRESEGRIASRILGVFLISTSVVAALLLLFVRRLLQPIRHLAAATKALAAGAIDVRVPVRSRDELGDLADSFNRMAQDLQRGQAEAIRLAAESATLETERLKAVELRQAYESLDAAHRELKETQAQLVQSGKLAGLGEIAAGIAHELNQPLTAVLGFAQRLRALIQREFPDRVAEADLILTSSRRMAQIVNNVRSFARQGDFVPQPTAPQAPVSDALMLLSEQLRLRSIEVTQVFPEDLPPVMADAVLLQQVFLNLLTNARDALEELPPTRPRRLLLEARVQGRWLVYRVQDNGPGVPEAAVSRIFDPFFTTKEVGKGMGLGLALTYGIVKKHGGEIDYHAASDGGAVFTVRVPIAERDSRS